MTGDTVWSSTTNISASTFEWQPLSYCFNLHLGGIRLRRNTLVDIIHEALEEGIDPRSLAVEAEIGHIYDRDRTIYNRQLVTGREMQFAIERELGENWEAELAFRLLKDHP